MEVKRLLYKKNIEGELIAFINPEYNKLKGLQKFEYYYKESKMPPIYLKWGWEDYQGEKSLKEIEKLKRFCELINDKKTSDINLFLFCNQNGTQKTATACNIGKEAIKRGVKVRFILWERLIDCLFKTSGFNADEYSNKVLNWLQEGDILIIDDCFDPEKGVMFQKRESNAQIISKIDGFFRGIIYNNKRFILTSNSNLENLKILYGESIHKMIDRNFKCLEMKDSVHFERKKRLLDFFDED